ncbi:hypothetical protein ABKV19_026353 [Rosa sericea]
MKVFAADPALLLKTSSSPGIWGCKGAVKKESRDLFSTNRWILLYPRKKDNDQVQEFPQQSHQNLRVHLKQRQRSQSAGKSCSTICFS